jgi:DNA-binding transcriptional LysR family regulator
LEAERIVAFAAKSRRAAPGHRGRRRNRIDFLFARARMEGLVRVLPRYTTAHLPVSIVSPSKRLEPARVVLLRDFLAAKLSALSWRG